MEKLLFTEMQFGRIKLKNRVVMAPMTRLRAQGNIPNELMVDYYGERAEAGLIITESTSPSPRGLASSHMPGLYSVEHVEGWKKVTGRVHERGGRIFAQLMHAGRFAHADVLPEGARVLGPSAIGLDDKGASHVSPEAGLNIPVEMSEADIDDTIEEFVSASRMAIRAGFDGVELHCNSSSLIDQFLHVLTNRRTDQWGGGIENRIHFAVETAKWVGLEIGFDRLGFRMSPYGLFRRDLPQDDDTEQLYEALVDELETMGLLHIHIADHSSMNWPKPTESVKEMIRHRFKGHVILAGGYNGAARAERDLVESKGDLIAFGRAFIANPDLVEKLKAGATLAEADSATFYTQGEKGYLDY